MAYLPTYLSNQPDCKNPAEADFEPVTETCLTAPGIHPGLTRLTNHTG